MGGTSEKHKQRETLKLDVLVPGANLRVSLKLSAGELNATQLGKGFLFVTRLNITLSTLTNTLR